MQLFPSLQMTGVTMQAPPTAFEQALGKHKSVVGQDTGVYEHNPLAQVSIVQLTPSLQEIGLRMHDPVTGLHEFGEQRSEV